MGEIKRICIFGTGGVGGYFGAGIAACLNKNKDREVYFIARGEHLDAIRSDGITLVTPEETIHAAPSMATDDIEQIPGPDLIFLCVKSYDLNQAVEMIRGKVDEETIILPLLNGIDIYERIRTVLKTGIVLPACVYVGTHIDRPGVIHQNGGDGKILFGKDPGKHVFDGKALFHFFENIGIRYQFAEDPFPAIWEKFMFIAAYGLVTAHTGKTVGEVFADDASKECLRRVMEEIAAIAKRKSIVLPENIIPNSIARGEQFPFDTKTSYQRDVEQVGRRNEGDLFGGAIIRQGRMLGIPTPATESLYAGLEMKAP